MNIKLLPLTSEYYQLTVIDNTQKVNGSSACICKCSCGNITKPIQNYKLTSGNTKSCGCRKKEAVKQTGLSNKGRQSANKDKKSCSTLVGQFFTNLRVDEYVGLTSCGHELYRCMCSCGKEITVNRSHLLSDTTKSCGCLRLEHIQKIKRAYRISKGFDPDVLMTPINSLVRDTLNKLHKQIKHRDKFTCQLCGKLGGVLHTHHIIPFSESVQLQTEPSNLVTLCKSCHINVAHGGCFTGLNLDIQDYLIEQMKVVN